MAASGITSIDASTSPRWFPSALVRSSLEETRMAEGVPTSWGRLQGWDWGAALEPSWWSSQQEKRWGTWPDAVRTVTVLAQTRHAVVVSLDDVWTAYLYPFTTGHDVSALARHAPWAVSLASAPVLLPVGGAFNEIGDTAVVFPHHRPESAYSEEGLSSSNHTTTLAIADSVGLLHAALVPHATPNAERRWNDRLKSMEDTLKTTTLWRAPHTRYVQGLPPVHLDLDTVVNEDGTVRWVPQPRPLMDAVLASGERCPGVATMAALEQRLALRGAFSGEEERRAFYGAWLAHVPEGWSSPSTLSSVNGGIWIWRYETILLMLAEARAYGLTQQAKQCDAWLLDVSRLQARLGELRTVLAVRKMALYAGVAAAFIGSGPFHLPAVAGCALTMGIAHAVYRRRLPSPY